jgi:hypothetical protein
MKLPVLVSCRFPNAGGRGLYRLNVWITDIGGLEFFERCVLIHDHERCSNVSVGSYCYPVTNGRKILRIAATQKT